MLTGLYVKLAGLALILALLAGLYAYGHHAGALSVQYKWDIANAAQAQIAAQAADKTRATEHDQSTAFAGIETGYLQATSHAYPSLADNLHAAIDAGTMQLRDDCSAPDSRSVPAATARARAADAGRAASATQRLADAVAAVQVSDASDTRERQLDAQVTALQALLAAERH